VDEIMTILGLRTPTASTFDQMVESMQTQQSSITQLQNEISSGLRVNKPSDDPTAAAQAVRVRSENARLDAEQRMVDYAKSVLQTADGAVGSAQNQVQSARSLLLQAANSTNSASDRAAIAQQLQAARDQLLSIANTPDGQGGYVFGGEGSTSVPFTSGATVTYTAQSGQQQVAGSSAISVTQDGQQAFMDVSTSGGKTSLFSTLDNAIAVLNNPNATDAQVQAATSTAINGLDSGLDQLNQVRTKIGDDLNTVTNRSQQIQDQGVNLQGRLSDLVDVDYAKTISELSQSQTSMNAAMQTYAQVSKMSLFTYL
jgi:flagellar hook-associated protein 3 FlgL